jgi:hypothetical protein
LGTLLRRIVGKPSGPWPELLERSKGFLARHARPKTDVRVLAATGVGSHEVVRLIDSLVAMGLWLRGAEVRGLLCDETLPACEAAMFIHFKNPQEFAAHGPQRSLCRDCFRGGADFLGGLPYPIGRYSQHLTPDAAERALARVASLPLEACFGHVEDELPLGEQARAGVLRFFGKAIFDDEDPALVLAVARRYLAGAIVTAQAARAALEDFRPHVVVAHHGVYVPQGVLGLVARRMGIRVVNWGPSYRNTTVIYSHGDTYHHTFMTEPTATWEDRPLSAEEDQTLMSYLRTRRGGKGDWSWVTPERGGELVEERDRLIGELGLSTQRPTFGLLTNVFWDAQLYYGGNVFRDMLDWLFCTLDFFVEHPEMQLVVRIHPHEVKAGNRQPTGPEIARRYPQLPPNIRIVDRDSPYSTYALMDLCHAVLIYGTKTGVELAPYGMPVVVGGEAWIKNKGIAIEPGTRDEYLETLRGLPQLQPLSPERIERAKRYAHHYFFRRMIPLRSLDPEGGYPPKLRIQTVEELLPGRDAGLDVVCDGILTGSEFVE